MRIKGIEKARKLLKEEFIKLTPAFQHKPFFMSDEYTVVDVTLSVIFWRLNALGIDIPKNAQDLPRIRQTHVHARCFPR